MIDFAGSANHSSTTIGDRPKRRAINCRLLACPILMWGVCQGFQEIPLTIYRFEDR
ncbi:UNVERIFIED_ORG: hypothetical protein ABIC62_004685 [Burkholderia sp. 1595]|uniref:Uncharacterized protein n=1 Tax=Paraburkholderia terricola TaxID=169427 RepID=A0ABU1LXA4_9BURK|nr:hypothetical protein [Paraburkholderia terricola]MDR6483371.1 hypothetical protein [Paraburkholderia terricola]